jgi:hypothetical protein
MLRTKIWAVALVLLWAAVSAHAQPGDFLAGGSSCQKLVSDCGSATGDDVDEIYKFALLGGAYGGPALGTCYVHDNKTPPGTTYLYACFNYVKVSYLSGAKGYDGGTGCVGSVTSNPADELASQHQAALVLQELCASGACCCPVVPQQPCGADTNKTVTLHDSVTGSCCTFPNHCSLPSGWPPSGWGAAGSADCR